MWGGGVKKVYYGSTLVFQKSEKTFVIRFKKGDYTVSQGFIEGVVYKSGQNLIGGFDSGYPVFSDTIAFSITLITNGALTDSSGATFYNPRTVYIGDIPFIGWRGNSDIYSGCDERLTAPKAIAGDYTVVGGIGAYGGGNVISGDNGVLISANAYNSSGGLFQTGSFQRASSMSSFNYFYRG